MMRVIIREISEGVVEVEDIVDAMTMYQDQNIVLGPEAHIKTEFIVTEV